MYRLGVGAIIVKSNAGIWQGKRKGAVDGWQLPQGGIEENEKPESAILREVYEETGIKSVDIVGNNGMWYQYDLPKEIKEKVWNGYYIGQRQRWFVLKFYGTEEEINIAKEPIEFLDWKWSNIECVMRDIVSFKHDAYEEFIRDYRNVIMNVMSSE
ncbi:RNA pyrophosphohydrolase [Candidatus Fokinia crypta]|uniref:RNA pyrophosphohydrolase n=1 Tax=Candidatus Fokinia crypta TaxID=1920990 RepID=A0ABZ0UR10_9RICK|nr:RNA pyrophosphohydrolase [Candidatus Fokinia cryptica]WPX97578.1 RNA pyrophosphohydrolase [Candidatus Fokinia cryptica]